MSSSSSPLLPDAVSRTSNDSTSMGKKITDRPILGDLVEARYLNWNKFYRGKVVMVNDDGTFDIEYDFGSFKTTGERVILANIVILSKGESVLSNLNSNVPQKGVSEVPQPLDDPVLGVGDRVEVNIGGAWYSGELLFVNGNSTYDVECDLVGYKEKRKDIPKTEIRLLHRAKISKSKKKHRNSKSPTRGESTNNSKSNVKSPAWLKSYSMSVCVAFGCIIMIVFLILGSLYTSYGICPHCTRVSGSQSSPSYTTISALSIDRRGMLRSDYVNIPFVYNKTVQSTIAVPQPLNSSIPSSRSPTFVTTCTVQVTGTDYRNIGLSDCLGQQQWIFVDSHDRSLCKLPAVLAYYKYLGVVLLNCAFVPCYIALIHSVISWLSQVCVYEKLAV